MVDNVHLSKRVADRASKTRGVASTIGAMLQPAKTVVGLQAREVAATGIQARKRDSTGERMSARPLLNEQGQCGQSMTKRN